LHTICPTGEMTGLLGKVLRQRLGLGCKNSLNKL
jgi:hypothetical protein